MKYLEKFCPRQKVVLYTICLRIEPRNDTTQKGGAIKMCFLLSLSLSEQDDVVVSKKYLYNVLNRILVWCYILLRSV